MNQADELLAIMLWIEQHHGDRAEVFIAEQIGAMALDGDSAGIEHWKAVAEAYLHFKSSARH